MGNAQETCQNNERRGEVVSQRMMNAVNDPQAGYVGFTPDRTWHSAVPLHALEGN